MQEFQKYSDLLKSRKNGDFLIAPQVDNASLTQEMVGQNQAGDSVSIKLINESPWILFLNGQEIVTNMTIGDFPYYLAVGYLVNQNMLSRSNAITSIDCDEDLGIVVVRTEHETNFETKLKKRVRTSGCAQGTIFGDLLEKIDGIDLSDDFTLSLSQLYGLTHELNQEDSLYLQAGAIHGCVLCDGGDKLVFMEDIGRHNAVDKIAGFMYLHDVPSVGKLLYTTGRLTSEMVIKTVSMGISVLVSRSGFTAWGVELARQCNLTLIGRARGKRFTVLSGMHRLYDDT